ncbi:MAG: ABC transporter permease [Lachnospiraceae bacterium]|nr:ABC transporter permease [Lachnospiraceae bacterium]
MRSILVYAGKKLLQMIIVLLIVSVIIFVLVRLSKTDPLAAIVGGKQTTPEILAQLRAKFGLDKPLIMQYFSWITGIFRGDFGMSFKYQTEAGPLILARIPVTLGLVLFSSILAMVIAIPCGVYASIKRDRPFDTVVSIISLVLAGCPPFLMSLLAILFLARFFPSYPFTGSYTTLSEYFVRMAAPSVALSFTMIALAFRMTRSSMIEQMQSQYTTTALAKGVPKNQIAWKHNFRNAIIPVLSVVSIQIGSAIVGAVLVETVFSLSGLGTLLIDSIKASDYALEQDITLMLVFVFLLISMIVDILYAVIDPRIRLK